MRRCAWSAPRLAMPALPCAAWSSGRSRGVLEHDADAARAPASSAATRQRCYVLPGAAGCCADEQLSLTRETSTHGSPRPLGRWWRRPTSRCRASEPPRASRGSTPSAGPLSSSCVSGSEARYRPLPDQIPLALCGGAEQVEGQLAPGGAGLDALGQGPERHPAPVEVTDDVDQVAQRPPEPVRPPHGDAVSDAQLLHHGVEGRAMLWLPGDPVDGDLVAAGCCRGVLLQEPGLARGWRRGRSRSGTWCSDSHYSARDQVRRR